MSSAHISMVGLYTRDRVASKIIYDSIFGPETCTDAPDGSHITIRFDNICLEMYEGVPKSMAILSATVPDLDRVRMGLRRCYLPVPYREENGVVYFEDRDGYRWEVIQKAKDAPSPAPSAELLEVDDVEEITDMRMPCYADALICEWGKNYTALLPIARR